MFQTVVIIGANRGIGFEIARRFKSLDYNVYGTYRAATREDPSVAELTKLGIKTLELDFADEASIIAAAKEFGPDQTIDILINVAGVYYLWDDKLFTEHEADDLLWHFKVNVLGPFLTSKHFLPIVARSKEGKIVNVSSDMASIADNVGGNVAYRVSKCALNQLTKTMSIDLEKVAPHVKTLAVHPGFVPTRMTGFEGPDDMKECMDSLVQVIRTFREDKGEAGEVVNGGYYRWSGKKMDY